MAEEEIGLPPHEIPWRLASTTLPLVAGEPHETTISVFFFEPAKEEVPEGVASDERIVYLKVTASISPAAFPLGTPGSAGGVLGVGAPCYHAQLDLKVQKKTGELGTIRPYFHAAAPLNRRAIQTGVVGAEVFEGEAEGHAIGKSQSQMYESSSTNSNTTSASVSANTGVGFGLTFGVSGGVRNTATDVTSARGTVQNIDQTTRDASEERRELVSHHTRVENVLTLLRGTYVGTPYLRFSLSPRPMTLLSVDPADQNVWFSQLLTRRSSGIEGIQEFTTVLIVPRDEPFCVEARLRRVCVLDVPPGPLELTERFSFQPHLGRLLDYLDRAYPPGTPLDDFDVDLVDALPKPASTDPPPFTQPVLENFAIASFVTVADVISPTPTATPGAIERASVNFKTHLELWLETLRDEYEREVARSPLERGTIVGESRTLDTCFAFGPGNGPLTVSAMTASMGPLQRFVFDPHELEIGGVATSASSARKSARERAYEAVTRWNLLQSRLVALLGSRERPPRQKDFSFDASILDAFLDRWAKLPSSDGANLPFDAAVKLLGLDSRLRRLLSGAGARDLRGIAELVRSTPSVLRYNTDVAERRRRHKAERRSGRPPDPVPWPLTAEDTAAIRRAIGARLEDVAAPTTEAPRATRRPRARR